MWRQRRATSSCHSPSSTRNRESGRGERGHAHEVRGGALRCPRSVRGALGTPTLLARPLPLFLIVPRANRLSQTKRCARGTEGACLPALIPPWHTALRSVSSQSGSRDVNVGGISKAAEFRPPIMQIEQEGRGSAQQRDVTPVGPPRPLRLTSLSPTPHGPTPSPIARRVGFRGGRSASAALILALIFCPTPTCMWAVHSWLPLPMVQHTLTSQPGIVPAQPERPVWGSAFAGQARNMSRGSGLRDLPNALLSCTQVHVGTLMCRQVSRPVVVCVGPQCHGDIKCSRAATAVGHAPPSLCNDEQPRR